MWGRSGGREATRAEAAAAADDDDDDAVACESNGARLMRTVATSKPNVYEQRSGPLMDMCRRTKAHKKDLARASSQHDALVVKGQESAIREADFGEQVGGRGQYKVMTADSMLRVAFGRIFDGSDRSRTVPTMFSTKSVAYWWGSDTSHIQRVRNTLACVFLKQQDLGMLALAGTDGGQIDIGHYTVMWDGQRQAARLGKDPSNKMPSIEGSFEVLQQRAELCWDDEGKERKEPIVVKPAVLRKATAACACASPSWALRLIKGQKKKSSPDR